MHLRTVREPHHLKTVQLIRTTSINEAADNSNEGEKAKVDTQTGTTNSCNLKTYRVVLGSQPKSK